MMQQHLVWAVGVATVLTACATTVGTERLIMPPADPLYARVKAECGEALMVRVVELDGDEAVCCVTYLPVPHLHCMTASGAVIRNPDSVDAIKEVVKNTP